MFQVSAFHGSDPDEQLVSPRRFATAEAAALYGSVLMEDPEIYEGADPVAAQIATHADLRDWEYMIVESDEQQPSDLTD